MENAEKLKNLFFLMYNLIMIKIGITGNIACGKSVAYDIIKSLGYCIVDCDDIVKELYNNIDFIAEVANIFPQIISENRINLKILSGLMFSDKQFKKSFESLIFPKVREKIIEYFENTLKNLNKRQDVTLNSFQSLIKSSEIKIFVIVPLLFEAGFEDLFEKIIFIQADENIRYERLIARNSMLSDIAEKVIKSQISEEEKIPKCDYIIKNNDTLEEFKSVVEKLLNNFI